jgi:DNA-directed RNA polymerase specialized sigma24 family protein
VKQRTRPNKLVSHLIEYREVTTWYHDPGLSRWEDAQWVKQLLNALPPAQRDAMAGVVDDFSPAEIGRLLGKDPAAIRQNLRSARQRLETALDAQPGRGPGIRPVRRPTEDR